MSEVTPKPKLYSPGLATPNTSRPQKEIAASQAEHLQLSPTARQFFERIVAGSGIDFRAGVLPLEAPLHMTTAERMRAFHECAPPLAQRAAEDALRFAGIDARDVTDLLIVTCTGFRSPGVGMSLAQSMGMRHTVRHSQIGFMGCFGGVSGLRAAAGLAALDPNARVLVICVELCSLHLRADSEPQNLIAMTLFADGAAAAVVSCSALPGTAIATLMPGKSVVIPNTEQCMTWTVTDRGFAMTLARDVPTMVEQHIRDFVGSERNLILHPGGPGIIDACVRAGVASDQQVSAQAPRAVLREHGNMSSGSVFFVLQKVMELAGETSGVAPAMIAAFGPGLTIDAVELQPISTLARH